VRKRPEHIAELHQYRIVVWSKHSVMTRSETSVVEAADRIEYTETAALYENKDFANGDKAEGLTQDELRVVVWAFHASTTPAWRADNRISHQKPRER
jgi:rhamnulose-1-phosphate aldolase